MTEANGYIAITNRKWNEVGRKLQHREVVCWTRLPSFKIVREGAPFFFVEKGTRLITGYGTFHQFEKCSVAQCWERYQATVGAESLDDFLAALRLPAGPASLQRQVGCILVKDVRWLDRDISIEDCRIGFHKAVVSGKSVPPGAVEQIVQMIEARSAV